ncbi:unnamed protein product [Oikopleura dioica]|uniref:DNA polymerase subunit gamma-1 n=1 Tax=Oikopleura dioica TaxID=34765 RepID=E4YZN1_OIKDI|nr:unnamed protein product [Oikopleura dioica]
MQIYNESCSDHDSSENLVLPELLSFDLIKHTEQAALAGIGSDFLAKISGLLVAKNLPKAPSKFVLDRPGWIKYQNGKEMSVDYPDEDALVFDTENLVQIGSCPVMTAAVSESFWYTWISPHFFSNTLPSDTSLRKNDLIDFGPKKKILIGHNVAFDRTRVKQEYELKSENIFIDTMSLHNSLHGVSSKQILLKKKSQSSKLKGSDRYLYGPDFQWLHHCSLSNLADVHRFYHKNAPPMDKEIRNIFVDGTIEDIHENLHDLMAYNILDVQATAEVFGATFPLYLARYPNPVNLFGMLKMGSPKMKINSPAWNEYVTKSNKEFEIMKNKLECDTLPKFAVKIYQKYETAWQDAVETQNFDASSPHHDWNADPFISSLDWTPATKRKPLPKWIKPILKENRVSMNNRSVPYLLRLEWKGKRVIHTKETGWAHVNFESDELTPLPHDKAGQKVGMLMTSKYSKNIIAGHLATKYEFGKKIIKDIMEVNTRGSYWRAYRERFKNLLIIKDEDHYNWHLPMQVPHGTVTRRAKDSFWMVAQANDSNDDKLGMGAFSLAQLDEDHVYVSADVDSQEIWIASLFADMYKNLGEVGVTGLSYMTLNGSKSAGTDIHTITANQVGMDRNSAKILNYARLYLCGKQNALDLLVPRDGAGKIVDELWRFTKGKSVLVRNPVSETGKKILSDDGIESELFNYLMLTAAEDQPTTPVLGGNLLMPLLNQLAPSHTTTRCNWLIQSSAVDFLHLFLANMDFLVEKYGINAHYSLSIHDMIQFISSKEDKYRTALAFQLAHLYTRAYFSLKCGLPQLPQNVAFFSSVEIDRSMRKDKDISWNTIFYGENPGPAESLDISRIIELTNGSLSK